ncbi:hypothetical protein SMD44_00065 [Streptomyces alboflavus]|uniref:Uncharacterized protein n=1 Tax=Streptomyces alboflavus TaxID=67267 RepID=A0A1Z1W2N3_9ACTN|nr:hypothetical protein [Streptomyces alboflavus]ARX80667.1 hypothetical protein SMD44_00065 [Streptomyces alboflavus]
MITDPDPTALDSRLDATAQLVGAGFGWDDTDPPAPVPALSGRTEGGPR